MKKYLILGLSIILLLTGIYAYAYVVGAPVTKLPPAYEAYAPESGAADQGVTDTGSITVKNLVDSIGTSKKATLIFAHTGATNTTTYTFTTNETIPSNISLWIEPGAILDGAGTLTINGPFEADLTQCFGSSITISFGSGAIKEVLPQWWGAKGDGTTDDSTAIQASLDSIKSSGGNLVFYEGNYLITTGLTLSYTASTSALITIKGKGNMSIITATTVGMTMLTVSTTVGNVRRVNIEDLFFILDDKANVGILFSYGYYNRIKDCWFGNFDGNNNAIRFTNSSLNIISGCIFTHGTDSHAIYLSQSANNVISHNIFGEDVGYGVYITTTGAEIIDSNQFWDIRKNAIYITTGNENIISNNMIKQVLEHGIYMTNAKRNIIKDNIINNYGTADSDAYDGVHIRGTNGSESEYNQIHGNCFYDGDRYDIHLETDFARYNQVGHNFYSGDATGACEIHNQAKQNIRFDYFDTVRATWTNPGAIADEDEVVKDITVTGAVLGDYAVVSLNCDLLDLLLVAQVTAADTVSVSLGNLTGGAVTLNGGGNFNVFVTVIKNAI